MDPRVDPRLVMAQTAATAPTARALTAKGEDPPHVAAELGVVQALTDRGNLRLVQHRATESRVA